jgi:hypothetical protein
MLLTISLVLYLHASVLRSMLFNLSLYGRKWRMLSNLMMLFARDTLSMVLRLIHSRHLCDCRQDWKLQASHLSVSSIQSHCCCSWTCSFRNSCRLAISARDPNQTTSRLNQSFQRHLCRCVQIDLCWSSLG